MLPPWRLCWAKPEPGTHLSGIPSLTSFSLLGVPLHFLLAGVEPGAGEWGQVEAAVSLVAGVEPGAGEWGQVEAAVSLGNQLAI